MSDLTAAGGPAPLHAATVRSPLSRGRIVSLRLPQMPDGYIALDASHIPGRNLLVHGEVSMPFLAGERVSYAGEPVALIAGPDRDRLAAIAREVAVDCERCEADEPGGPSDDGALLRELAFERGDPDAAFASAARVIEGAYSTGFQESLGSLSPGAVAFREDRDLHITCASSDPFLLRDNVAALLDVAPARVRVHADPAPCPIAGRMLYPMLMAGHAALLASVVEAPVRLVYTQKESLFFTPKRPPCAARWRAALDQQGALAAMEVELDFDVGASALFSTEVLQRALIASCGGYRCDHVRARARLLASARPPSASFAGCGEPQAFFALERHVERIAAEVGQTPWEWRRRHLAGVTVFPSGMRWNREDPLELLEDALERSDFRRKWAAYEAARKRRAAAAPRGPAGPLTVVGRIPAAPPDAGPLRGIGLAVTFHGVGLLLDSSDDERSSVRVLLDHNRKLRIFSSQAADREAAVWVRTAARLLDIPQDDVILEPVDTAEVPDSGPAMGSRVASQLNDVVASACRAIHSQRLKRLAPIQTVRSLRRPAGPYWNPASPRGQAYHGLCWEATVVEMEIDPITFQPRCRSVWTTLEGDADSADESTRVFLEGSLLYNLDLLMLDKGRYVDGVWVETVPGEPPVLGILDAPEVHLRVVDRGKRGFGDLAVLGAAPAGAAAIEQAVGAPVSAAPLSAAALAAGSDA